MDPLIGSALIGAGSSLLGGLFGSKPPTASQNFKSHMKGVMQSAEKYGFNPLTLLGVNAGSSSAAPNYMGQAIADAGMMLADGMQKKAAEKGRVSQLEDENRKLQEKLQQNTIRPKFGGVYQQQVQTPGLGFSLGRNDASISRLGVSPALSDSPALAFGQAGGVAVPDTRLDRGTGYYINGSYVIPAPGWSPASVIEEEYGDIGSSLYGGAKLAADLRYTEESTRRPRKGDVIPAVNGTKAGTVTPETISPVDQTKAERIKARKQRPEWIIGQRGSRWTGISFGFMGSP
jgi:hypothetical protein